jgi:hypothetical protein
MLLDRTVYSPCDTSEPPECADDRACVQAEHNPFCLLLDPSRLEDKVVKEMSNHQDGEVESW